MALIWSSVLASLTPPMGLMQDFVCFPFSLLPLVLIYTGILNAYYSQIGKEKNCYLGYNEAKLFYFLFLQIGGSIYLRWEAEIVEPVWNEKGNNFPVPAADPDTLTTREAFTVPDLVLHELCSSFGMSWCTIACL